MLNSNQVVSRRGLNWKWDCLSGIAGQQHSVN